MAHKILRTIIGLPFVLVIQPLMIVLSLAGFLLFVIGTTYVYVRDGVYEDDMLETSIFCLTFPYQFIKKVWGF